MSEACPLSEKAKVDEENRCYLCAIRGCWAKTNISSEDVLSAMTILAFCQPNDA